MRIRLRFTKLGRIRFTSQRDVARMWERALRRAGLPLAYTEGFSPRPQLSFGLALPTGCESLAEYLDVVLDRHRPETAGIEVEALPGRLSDLLPAGIEVEAAAPIERRAGSLQQEVTSCSWSMDIAGISRDELEAQVRTLLAAPVVPIVRERKGREEHDDLRPSVLALAVEGHRVPAGRNTMAEGRRPIGVVAELATRPRGVRPIELVRGLVAASGGPAGDGSLGDAHGRGTAAGTPVLDRARRTQQWIEREGIREEPLRRRGEPTGTHRAAHALERAS
ncbi:MAG TPA: TIGR03936 family radical SAM-associated protein [Acidimicrobiales bacterium]|nr:TIGR03936 family radical SAM-associated protein [Acidimicrobiales bacterium]